MLKKSFKSTRVEKNHSTDYDFTKIVFEKGRNKERKARLK